MVILKNILKPLASIGIPFGGEIVTVWYRPQYLSPEFENRLKSLSGEDHATDAFLELFVSVIERWDLALEEGGEAIPITKEAISAIPYEILGEVIGKVQEAVTPDPPTGLSYEDTSFQAVGSAQSPTGTP